MIVRNYYHLPNSQFCYLIVKLIDKKKKCLEWHKKENRIEQAETVFKEIELLKEIEKRLELNPNTKVDDGEH